MLIAEIEKGIYNQRILSETIGISEPTLRKFLRSDEGAEIESLRLPKRPSLKENGRAAYLKEYAKERWAKIKAEKMLLVSENAVKAEKVDEGNGASN